MHYGWIIALTSMVILLISNGTTIPGINVFDEALLNEFGWARDELKRGPLITFILAGILAPLAGAIADRIGVKKLMLAGAALLAVTFLLYSRIQNLTHLYLMHCLFGLVLITAGLVVNIMLVSNWFNEKRGTAIGIALIGTSLGGTIFPPLLTSLIQTYGWRQTFVIEAGIAVLLFVIVLVMVRDFPRHKGLEPIGGHPRGSGDDTELPGMTFGEALRTPTFWALAFAAMTTFYAILGAQAHLFLYLRDIGFEPTQASLGLSTLFLAALVGKFVFGTLADRFPQKAVLLANIAVMFAGALCLASMSVPLFWVADVLFGLGWGGLYTLIQLLAVNSFGLKAAGKVLGTITIFDAIGGGLGPFVLAVLYERSGSYQLPFTTLAVLIGLAFLAALMVRPENSTDHSHENSEAAA